MVGLGRLELPTSRLSGVRSNHLSYRPFSLTGTRIRVGQPKWAIYHCATSRATARSSSERKRNEDGDIPLYNVTRINRVYVLKISDGWSDIFMTIK